LENKYKEIQDHIEVSKNSLIHRILEKSMTGKQNDFNFDSCKIAQIKKDFYKTFELLKYSSNDSTKSIMIDKY